MLTKEELRKNSIERQWYVPSRHYDFLERFEYIPWRTVVNLWRNSVAQTLYIFNTECLLDIPFGKGFTYAYKLFEEAVIMADKEAVKKELERLRLKKEFLKLELKEIENEK